MTLRDFFRSGLRPAILLPIVLAAALLLAAFKLGDLGAVIGRIQSISILTMLFALVLGLCYLGLKFWQLRLLLADLKLHPHWRHALMAFTVGELSLTLPFGIFAQNWVLSTHSHMHFGRTSAATVVMLLVETLVVLLFLAVVGAPGWPLLSPLAGACAAGLVAFVLAILRFDRHIHRLARRTRNRTLHRALVEIQELVMGLKRLSNPRVLVVNILLAGLYLAALTLAFTWVGRDVGLTHLHFLTASSIYAFSLAGVLLFGGLISQIGTVEVLGMGAAQAWGFDFADGLALMLGFRLVWTGVMWLVNLPLFVALWRAERVSAKRSVDNIEKAVDRPGS